MSNIRTLIENKTEIETLKNLALSDSDTLKDLFEILQEKKGTAKFAADKVIRAVAAENATVIIPYADILIELLDSSNNFIKWGTILTIPYLSEMESGKLDIAISKLRSLAEDAAMVSSLNAISSLYKISKIKTEIQPYLMEFMLNIDTREYYKKGELSPECTNVAIANVIDIFSTFSKEEITSEMLEFAERNKNNSRPSVRNKVEKFLKV